MLGQNVIPRALDPVVDGRSVAEIEPKLAALRRAMNEYADALPSHEAVLRRYCAHDSTPVSAQRSFQ